MKYTDDIEAKLKIWIQENRVQALPKPVGLPSFRPQKFSSYEAMNTWKAEYRREIARKGGVTWTK